MRAVVILTLLLGTALFFGNRYMATTIFADQGHLLAMAFGGEMGDTIQVHLGVPPRLTMLDPRQENDEGKTETLMDWIRRHFELWDESNNLVPLQKMGTSGLLIGTKAGGAPELALVAELKKGASYTFEVVPIVSEGKRYRYSFTAPNEETKARRSHFQFVTTR